MAVSIEAADGDGRVEWGVTLHGHSTVVEDPDRIEAAETWVYDCYDGHETDGGDDEAFDPGEPGVDYALLEIAVGSAALQVDD